MGLFIGKHYSTLLCIRYFRLSVFASSRFQRLLAACSECLSQQIISTHLNINFCDLIWLFRRVSKAVVIFM